MIFPKEGLQTAKPAESDGYVSFTLAGQWLGIPVIRIQEVLVAQRVSPVPLAPSEVAGFLNLRGQIVTAIDLRARLGLPAREGGAHSMNIVVRDDNELFSLIVDTVGDVVKASADGLEAVPRTLDAHWRSVCDGVIRMPVGLLLVLSVNELLRTTVEAA